MSGKRTPGFKKTKKLIIPGKLVPFSKMDKADKKTIAVCEYENDTEFSDLLAHPDKYIEILKQYQGFISPDCSIYRDMPLAIQNVGINNPPHPWNDETGLSRYLFKGRKK